MELTKLQCTSCGDALEIKPGINRVKCRSCGMTYLIEKKDSGGKASGAVFTTGDNPADILLVPVPENSLCLNIHKMTSQRREIQFPGKSGILASYDVYEYDEVVKDILRNLKFVAALAYVTKRTYPVEIGRLTLDPVYLYYTGRDNLKERGLSEKDIPLLKEPDHYYRTKKYGYHGANLQDGLKHWLDGTDVYNKAINQKFNQTFKAKVDAFLKQYRIQYKDEVCYSPVANLRYEKPGFLLATPKLANRYWTMRYVDRRLSIDMDESTAELYLSAQDKATIDKIGRHEFVQEMAARIYQDLPFSAKGILERKFVYHGYEYCVTKDRLNCFVADSGRFKRFEIPYSTYGMKPFEDYEMQSYLAAHLIGSVFRIIEENKDIKWNLTDFHWLGAARAANPNIAFQLHPSLKSVAVYNDWA